MMKLQYNGDIKDMIVRKFNSTWKIGEVKEVSNNVAKELLKLDGFTKLNKPTSKVSKKEEKESIDFDFNNDGIVDDKDMSIAGKALAYKRSQNK